MLKRKRLLTPLEQKIYFSLKDTHGSPVSIDLIRSYGLVNGKTLKVTLSSMVRKGWLERVKNGVYVAKESPEERLDPFLLAPMRYNGYLAFSSAMYVYNASDERPSVIYVANTVRSCVKKLYGLDIEIRAVALRSRALGMGKFNGYVVSTRAKTLYDCFYLPEYAGGYARLLSGALRLKMGGADWLEFATYIDTFEGSSFKRKVGYMLDLLGRKGASSVPKWVTRRLNVNGPAAKLGAGKNGRYVKEWNLIDYIGASELLGGLNG
jgi:predicted transcriptional regulator of viral defense system